jgi:hypothetical protein
MEKSTLIMMEREGRIQLPINSLLGVTIKIFNLRQHKIAES